ncbi:MAG: cytochrome P450 [Gammaproteobacteria bacterium]|nr:cytochrome P450 [Gammaproteobacteria bacterium]
MSDTNDAYHKISVPPAAQPRGCPFNGEFTPFDDAYLMNPYPHLEKLNAQTPIFYSEQLGYLVVTGMDNVVEVLKNHEVFSSENVQDPVFPVCEKAREVMSAPDYNPQAVMSNAQQPNHTRIRKFTREGFNARRMKMLEPYIRATTEALIDEMLANGAPAEFVSALAHPLPGQVIFRFIGFPEQDDAQLIYWTANRLVFTWGHPTDEQQVEIAENMLRYWRYCREFVAMRSEQPADDLTSELLAAHREDPQGLTYREVESIIYGLSFAGHEIVSNFIALSLLNILPNRDHWQKLCDDPAGIPNALEEVLRFDSPQTSWRRVATRDTQLNGVDIPKGTRVFISLGSANHDPEIFEQAGDFNADRANANRHISFGHGIHFCLGARLARLEGQIAMEALTRRLPDIRIVPDQQLTFSPNITFRGPSKLFVEWGG